MSEPSYKITSILGTDNTSDPSKLQPRGNGGLFFRELLNIDIDDENMSHRRKGYAETPIVSGSGIHSWWSNGEIGLFVEGTDFKKIEKDLTVTTLIVQVNPTERIAYVAANDRIFFSNNAIIGYIYRGLSYPFLEPNQAFKIKMVGGHILEFYNSRLYTANGSNLFYSDATILTQMDQRKNAKAFPGRITMVKAVGDGLYVSSTDKNAGDKTYFLKGGDPGDFASIQVLDEAAIEGSAISMDGDDIGRGASGKTVYFLTPSGPYKGYPGGIVVQRQGGLFGIDDDVEMATSILKTDRGYQQYISIYELRAGVGGGSGEFVTPRPIADGLG